MSFELLEREQILVSYQGTAATQEQWDHYLDQLATLREVERVRFLVYADGSPPTPGIQRRIAGIAHGHDKWLVALVSPSTALRFVVSAFKLVNRSIRFFTPAELHDALSHIQCDSDERGAVQNALRRLQG